MPPGTIVTLSTPPFSVNVEILDGADDTPWPCKSIVPKKRVIPILLDPRHRDWDTFLVHGGPPYPYRPSYVMVRSGFPFELAFSMTLHKAQGRTLDQVILAFGDRPTHECQMDFSGIYVGFSRVRKSGDIRYLLPGGDYSKLQYITQLKPDPTTKTFFSGFRGPLAQWDPLLAYDSCLPKM